MSATEKNIVERGAIGLEVDSVAEKKEMRYIAPNIRSMGRVIIRVMIHHAEFGLLYSRDPHW